jgi:DNA polymerase (family 10)
VQSIPPELRDSVWPIELARQNALPVLIEEADIRGVVHTHSTYSDGINTVRQMAEASRERGYEYLVMSDHSQAAFYANGLKADRVREQWREIDALNEEMAPFRILKGTECDILSDGSLDYDEELLAGFDLVIASVHSNLNMDEERAMERLLAAIANPYTNILGHPTGRLLLSREGYPIDHAAVIDACAEHRVAIELNANPYRLDLDWSWVPYAVERGVKVSINPDAHSTGGIDDIHYGVLAARKGGLRKVDCLNTRGVEDLLAYFS